MIDKVVFKNFKMLRDATLPLGRFTLLIGPNSSGKSTALNGIWRASRLQHENHVPIPQAVRSIGSSVSDWPQIEFHWRGGPPRHEPMVAKYGPGSSIEVIPLIPTEKNFIESELLGFRSFCFDPAQIAAPVNLSPTHELQSDGSQLAGVLDRLRDNNPERFEAINVALAEWFPDYDRILFETPANGMRAFQLRARESQIPIKAAQLSDGTLLAIAILTLAYLPNPPTIITIEEPDRGIHPRLLRRLQDALYRLCYPEGNGEKRSPVQVIATTHSPYFLDLFKDHPEEIVIAEKNGLDAKFGRLSDQPYIGEVLQDAPLGEAWFTGILGGVPVNS
jgi:predicted ATPase